MGRPYCPGSGGGANGGANGAGSTLGRRLQPQVRGAREAQAGSRAGAAPSLEAPSDCRLTERTTQDRDELSERYKQLTERLERVQAENECGLGFD